MSKRILVIGAGVIGLSTAYYCARRGHRVTVIDRNADERDGCSFGNAGMVVPSHFVPLAAPGVGEHGAQVDVESRVAALHQAAPELGADVVGLEVHARRECAHVERSAPLIRDLSFASRDCFEELAALPDNDFGLVKKGLVMLCKTQHGLDDEAKYAAQANELGVPAQVLDAKALAKLDPDGDDGRGGRRLFPEGLPSLAESLHGGD